MVRQACLFHARFLQRGWQGSQWQVTDLEEWAMFTKPGPLDQGLGLCLLIFLFLKEEKHTLQ